MSVAKTIERKLTDAFSPRELIVVDESHLHIGHAGARPDGESHFRVEIVADAFQGMSRVARQRAVYDALSEELADRVHALSLTARG
tara:strand:+ start:2720 stop:2977 length:258 start_codon:yes stop_codon:yes gene_type:complete